MNKVTIGVVSGIGGCAIGSIVTYFIMDSRLKRQYDEEVEEAKKYYEERYNADLYEKIINNNEYTSTEEEIDQEQPVTNEKVTIDEENYDRQRIIESLDYTTKYGHDYKEKTKEDKEFREADTETQIAEDSFSPIWVITGDEYYDDEDNPEFERYFAIYIPEDDVLITQDGQVYGDDRLENYHEFIDRDAEDGELYICDSRRREYYRINIDDRDYATYMADYNS